MSQPSRNDWVRGLEPHMRLELRTPEELERSFDKPIVKVNLTEEVKIDRVKELWGKC